MATKRSPSTSMLAFGTNMEMAHLQTAFDSRFMQAATLELATRKCSQCNTSTGNTRTHHETE
ncbi:hypothetical protein O9992_05225 [Vibrio lentus]|nr:hypothetical protein [Vibrio lentus]